MDERGDFLLGALKSTCDALAFTAAAVRALRSREEMTARRGSSFQQSVISCSNRAHLCFLLPFIAACALRLPSHLLPFFLCRHESTTWAVRADAELSSAAARLPAAADIRGASASWLRFSSGVWSGAAGNGDHPRLSAARWSLRGRWRPRCARRIHCVWTRLRHSPLPHWTHLLPHHEGSSVHTTEREQRPK